LKSSIKHSVVVLVLNIMITPLCIKDSIILHKYAIMMNNFLKSIFFKI
jgi:hypothetical protein